MSRSYRQQGYTQSDAMLDGAKGEEKVRSKAGLCLSPCGCDLSWAGSLHPRDAQKDNGLLQQPSSPQNLNHFLLLHVTCPGFNVSISTRLLPWHVGTCDRQEKQEHGLSQGMCKVATADLGRGRYRI